MSAAGVPLRPLRAVGEPGYGFSSDLDEPLNGGASGGDSGSSSGGTNSTTPVLAPHAPSPLELWMGLNVRVVPLNPLLRLGGESVREYAGKSGALVEVRGKTCCLRFERAGGDESDGDGAGADADAKDVWFPTTAVRRNVSLDDVERFVDSWLAQRRCGSYPAYPEEALTPLPKAELHLASDADTFRKKVWAFVEPSYAEKVSSTGLRAACTALSYLTQTVIVACVTMDLISTLPQSTGADSFPHAVFTYADLAFVSYFCAEFLLRVCSTPDQRQFWSDSFTWIDLLSVLPFFAVLVFGINEAGGIGSIRVLRIIARASRVSRGLKLARHSVGIRLFVAAVKRSRAPLMWHVLTTGLMVLTSGTVLYYIEREACTWDGRTWLLKTGYGDSDPDDPTNCAFQSVFDALWWAAVTISTVGYGDVLPVTTLGKVVSSITMMLSVLVQTFPIVILTSSFNTVYRSYMWTRYRRHVEEDPEIHDTIAGKFAKAKVVREQGGRASSTHLTSSPTSPPHYSPNEPSSP
eukprot:gene11565-17810_t